MNGNASNPHYDPSKDSCSEIQQGRFGSDRYVGEAGPAGERLLRHHLGRVLRRKRVPEKIEKVFDVVTEARDRGIRCVQKAVAAKKQLRGFEVDDAARALYSRAGVRRVFLPPAGTLYRHRDSWDRRKYGQSGNT